MYVQEAKTKQKQLKRRAMGLDGIATDIIDQDELFSLSALKDQSDIDAVAEVNLETADPLQIGIGADDDDDGDDDPMAGKRERKQGGDYVQVRGWCGMLVVWR